MKKHVIMVLLATFILSACGSPTTNESEQSAKTQETTTHVEQLSDPTIAETPVQTTETIVAVEEQEIFNQDGVKVTVKGFDQDSMGPYLDVLVENDTENNIIVQAKKPSLNGYMSDFTFSCEVAPGKKSNDKIKMDLTSIELCGIGKIYDIEFYLTIMTENFSTIATSEMIHIKRNLIEQYTQSYDDSGTIVYDQNDIKIVWKDIASDDYYTALLFYIENNRDEEIIIQARNTSIDGFMVDPIMSIEILPGKKAVDTMAFYTSDLKSNGITDIKSIETSFHITSDDFTKTIVDTDSLIIKVN